MVAAGVPLGAYRPYQVCSGKMSTVSHFPRFRCYRNIRSAMYSRYKVGCQGLSRCSRAREKMDSAAVILVVEDEVLIHNILEEAL